MYDASNNDVYPITHLRAVRDSNGTTLESMIQGVNETTVGYYECNTAGSTPEKAITIDSSVSLSVRISCKVKFAEKNTGANATMNINNTGAKPLFYNGVRAAANNSWYTNEIVDLYFDGTNYQAKSCADTLEYDVSLHQTHEITEVTTTTRTVVYNGDVTSGWENETSVSDSSVNGYTRTETNTGKDNDTTTVDGPTAKYDTTSNKTSVVYVTKRTLTHVVNDYTFDEAVNAVPMSYRHGGLKLRFISNSNGSLQNSDNKYVQWRLMATSWSTTVSDWQGVDDEPIFESNNLVKSGGVAKELASLKMEVEKSLVYSNTGTKKVIGGILIPAGSKIKVLVTSNDAVWTRFAVFGNNKNWYGDWYIDNLENGVEKEYTTPINITTIYGYLITATTLGTIDIVIKWNNVVTTDKIADGAVTNAKIENSTINIDKLNFHTIKKNLIDTSTIITGKYCNTVVGNTISYNFNTIYFATDKIPIEFGKTYTYSVDGSVNNARFFVLVDSSNKSVRKLESVSRFTAQEGEVFVIVTGYTSTGHQKAQLEEGNVATSYEDYKIVISKDALPEIEIQDNEITTNKIADESITSAKLNYESVTEEKTSFFTAGNLFNQNDPDVEFGKYINSNAVINDNPSYNITGYIKVKPNTTYALSSLQGNTARTTCQFNINKTCLNIDLQNTNFITTSANTYFIRVTFYANKWKYGQVTEGDSLLNYMEYGLKIPSSKVLIDPSTLMEDIVFFLPKDIYVANGRTIEIYYEQICLNSHRYNIQATCSIGKALDRKFQIIGDSDHVGNTYTLTINVRNDSQDVLASGTSTIHIVSNTLAESKTIIPIGDSLTNNKYWLNEVHTLSNSMISFIGTRQNRHEGRSGASVGTYMNVEGGSVYDFDHTYTGIGSDSDVFSEEQTYSVGDFCRYNNGSSTSVYVFTTTHPAGAWDANHVYNVTEGNPFYDWETGEWSLTAYKTRNSLNYDAIMIFLGTNGMNLTPETNPNGALGIKNLIDNIRLEDASTPIIVVNTIFRSSQNGIGNQGNTDGYTAQSEYKFNADKKVLLLAKALKELIGEYSNVYLCPCGFTMDSKYDYGNVKTQVNPRLTSTDVAYELYPNDSVHPQQVGYEQIADEMFSTLCAVFNN